MTPEQFHEFQSAAVQETSARNDACEREFGISIWDRWECDLDEGLLTFSRNGVVGVVARVQVVGSTSTRTNSWLWSWANSTIPEHACEAMQRVRAYGVTHGIAELTQERLPAGEDTGWNMASIAARLLGAKGSYRCEGDNGYLYLVYMEIGHEFPSAMVQ